MISFSKEEIVLDYRENKNLTGHIEITNRSDTSAYFKFRVNRPKFYLVKPDRGFIKSSETKHIEFTLHRDGLSQALNDKFKCYYAFLNQHQALDNMTGFQDRPNTTKHKLYVKIAKLPSGIQIGMPSSEIKSSGLKSMGVTGSQFQSGFKSTRNSSTLEGILKQKQERMASLRQQIQNIERQRMGGTLTGISQKKKSMLPTIMVGLLGIGLGVLSSFWI